MDKKSDALLRKLLKNWAGRQSPPDNARARLIWNAARTSSTKKDPHILLFRPSFTPYSYSNEWTQSLFTWINENSFQFGIQARLS